MNLLTGGSLGTYLKHFTPIPEDKIKQIFSQILHAIKYIHDLHIIHRDIKPDNLLFKKKCDKNLTDIYLVDFGLA